MLILETPTIMRLVGYENKIDEVRKLLTFVDKKIEWQYKKFRENRWLLRKLKEELGDEEGEAEFQRKAQLIWDKRERCILFQDSNGYWTYTGLRSLFQKEYGDSFKVNYSLPEAKSIPWDHMPKYNSRYYQIEAQKKLLEANKNGPAAVELATGLGKTKIILDTAKDLALKTLIMVPTANIANQMYKNFIYHLGRGKVGKYGDGKKEFNKLITIGIAASLTRLEPEDEAYQELSKCQVFLNDECHLSPAETLVKVCFGMAANAPYRQFLSGTQMRGDGLDLLLEAITGQIVYSMDVKEGVDRGFLAKPKFAMSWTDSKVVDKRGNILEDRDVNKNTQAHVYLNPIINQKAAELANKFVSSSRPVIILIDELQQIKFLAPHLRFQFKFAHGGVTDKNKKLVPKEYHKSDPDKYVEEFNNKEFPILIGTSCIGIGTDIIPVKTILNLRGGASEVEINQNVGRGTRKEPGKEDFIYVDFGIKNVESLNRHAKRRIKILREIYPNLSEIEL